MNTINYWVALVSMVLLAGCTTSAQVVTPSSGATIEEMRNVSAEGERKRVAVLNFEDKSARGARGVGRGLTDMLVDSLFNTNRFIVLERERLDDLLQEQDLVDTGRFRQETVAPKGELEGAELVIKGAITQFEENCRGASLLLISAKQACVAINLRIVDVATGRIVNATTVEGTSANAGVGLVFTTSPLPVGLGAFSKTPMEQAMRQAIEAAVQHIVAHRL